MLVRAALLVVAAAALVWLGLWLNQTMQIRQADRQAFVPGATKDPARVRALVSDFERARAHTPDSFPLMDEGLFLFEAGARRRAAALAAEVVRREPRNVSAWSLLGQADPARAAEARRRIAELNPLALRGH
jgi:hypothetical protein